MATDNTAATPAIHPLTDFVTELELIATEGPGFALVESFNTEKQPYDAIINTPDAMLAKALGLPKLTIAGIKAKAAEYATPKEEVKIEIKAEGHVEEEEEKRNPWDEISVEGDEEIAGLLPPVLTEDLRAIVSMVGELMKYAALEKAGIRTLIWDTFKMRQGTSGVRIKDAALSQLIFQWGRKAFRDGGSDDMASASERVLVFKLLHDAIPDELDEILQTLSTYGASAQDLKAIQGSTLALGSLPSLTVTAGDLPDILRQAAVAISHTDLTNFGPLFASEWRNYLLKVIEHPEFQSLCGIQPDMTDPRATVVEALEQKGIAIARPVLSWGNEAVPTWRFLSMCPGEDTDYALSLGRRCRASLRANRQIEKAFQNMASGGGAAEQVPFRGVPQHIVAPSVVEQPKSVKFIGFKLSAALSVSISR